VLSGGSLASDATLQSADGEWVITGDPTEAAFLVAERKAGFTADRDARFRRVGEVPFTAERKLMSTLQAETAETGGMVGIVTKGAPDVLLTRCTHERVGADAEPLTAERSREIQADVDHLAGQAFRTLGVAYRFLEHAPDDVAEHLEHGLVFAGVAGIIDPSRPEAGAAVDEAHRAGIRVVMITGDHPRTAGRIADDLGIMERGGRVVTGADLDRLDEVARRQTAVDASVYARVAPEHKLLIVDALRADGSIVAMTGDGVNDAPALKKADIGIAMGITGTEVAKEAADMILTDDNFATIVSAVREGRGIFANIRKFLRYLLSSNIGEVLTMLLGVIFAGVIGLDGVPGGIAVPLLATQILWINLLTDSAPALALGVDPPPDDAMTRPPRGLKDRVIDAQMLTDVLFVGLVMGVATLLTLDAGLTGGLIEGQHGITEARTMAFTTLVLAQLFNCFNARSDRESAFHHLFTNRTLWVAIAVSLLLQIAVVNVPFLNAAFDTSPLAGSEWLLCAAMASSVLWANEIWKLAKRRRRPSQRGSTRDTE
jgi:calcium-translocating P-type ATPase